MFKEDEDRRLFERRLHERRLIAGPVAEDRRRNKRRGDKDRRTEEHGE